jgi:hypothetical protein
VPDRYILFCRLLYVYDCNLKERILVNATIVLVANALATLALCPNIT